MTTPDHPLAWPARTFAAVIAAAAWAGLGLEFAIALGRWGSAAWALWSLLRFFTITTNLLIALVFTGIAAGRGHFARSWITAGLGLSILLVGIVFKLLLEGVVAVDSALGNALLHRVTPILVPLFWLAFTPKGQLRPTTPLVWVAYPVGYFAYALVRGAFGGIYPYPFMDVAAIGWGRTAINALVIGLGFTVTGFFWVWLDRILPARRPPLIR